MSDAALIGLDWGTTSLRAHLIGTSGAVISRRSSAEGILADHPGGFPGTFNRIAGDWLEAKPGLPVVASGMITSRNGWVETPYVRVPAGVDELASSLVSLDVGHGRCVHFVCGMDQDPIGGNPDIMRGEETQIVGCLAMGGGADGLFVMPGTHSKWVNVQAKRLERFDTYMTGEVYAVLKEHSILGRLAKEPGEELTDGFTMGVAARLDATGSLLRQLFSARTLTLFDRLKPEEVSDYLSGLLIGEEIRAASIDHGQGTDGPFHVTIVGSGPLTERYRLALELSGIAAEAAPLDAAALGQHAIAKQAGLLGG